jgi:hypothetical protein
LRKEKSLLLAAAPGFPFKGMDNSHFGFLH